uniref:Uncharacterized protein n=1 Tax=Meloidogyne enterolobii TaxID=390850 RepID=A0A6V7U922_MELEN|nr:unnamed protein product [Meloidogyne enterolobii]
MRHLLYVANTIVNCFLTVIEGKRSAENLIPLIQQHTDNNLFDLWKAYNSIPRLPEGYSHGTVNHSKNFVNDEDIYIHTQNIELVWSSYKRKYRHKLETTLIHTEHISPNFCGVNDLVNHDDRPLATSKILQFIYVFQDIETGS